MFDPTAMIMADKATKHHVLSARPQAPTTPERPPRQRGDSIRQRAATTLRRLADKVEPRRVETCAPAT
ncbi:hypothetical protein GCM10022251_66210 [Phytohabitans flavus]|uniref:Uncharacterized protein n=1 Tax=Phytohabitans flavus TaxID=1076124 RepID=A0A6F8Y963_9ACTN|nr:hypothetical protein [Phytohabitans flavus]BCB82664.1 hypothetical protein Pflav_090740 [Phytohabitans flavus]